MKEFTFEEFCQLPLTYTYGFSGYDSASRVYRNHEVGVSKDVYTTRKVKGDIYSGWNEPTVFYMLDGDTTEYPTLDAVYVAYMYKVLGDLAQRIKSYGNYLDVRILEDGSIAAMGDLMFTRALYLGCTEYGWERRFCFSDVDRAVEEYKKLKSQDDKPEGWIARRPPGPHDYDRKG